MDITSLFLAAMLLAIALIDLRDYRIPDYLSLPLIVVGLIQNAPLPAHLLGAGLGYATFALFGAVYFRLRGQEGLGLGDAKLFAAAGAWLGWQPLPLVLAIASLGALAYALATLRLRPDPRIAFGPWIALGIWIAWIMPR